MIIGRGDWTWPGLCALQLALIILVPKEVAAILAVTRKRVKLLVKREPVDCENLCWLRIRSFRIVVNSVALEAEIVRGSN